MTPLLLFLTGCAIVYLGTVVAAFTALMRLSLRIMAEREGSSDALQRALEDPARLFVPARVTIGLLLALASALLALQIGAHGWRSVGLLLLAVAAFDLICEHFVPWLIVRRNPQRVLEVLLPSFGSVVTVLSPVTRVAQRALRRGRGTSGAAAQPAAELPPGRETAVAEPEGIDGEERELLRSIVDFGGRLVREVMTPRPDIVAIQAEATLDELRAFFREQEYSRIPIYKDDLDNIQGFVFVKDLIKHASDAGSDAIASLVRPAYFVPETKRVPELLKEFQRKQVQSAIVVDEYGGTAGLVTLEDLIEEIVGEIRDEYDVEAEPVAADTDGSFVVSGKAHVDEMREKLDVDVAGEGFETVGGYLLSRLGRVPAVGETFEVGDLSIEVLEAERRRIHKVRIRRKQSVAREG